jgi:hypothetical protein
MVLTNGSSAQQGVVETITATATGQPAAPVRELCEFYPNDEIQFCDSKFLLVEQGNRGVETTARR